MFLSLLIFLSIAGNILVCLAIYTERSLRRIGNLFLASLAIADLFVASLVMTFAGVNDLLGMYRHDFHHSSDQRQRVSSINCMQFNVFPRCIRVFGMVTRFHGNEKAISQVSIMF